MSIWKTLLRFGVTVLLLTWIVLRVDVQQVGTIIRTANPSWLIAGASIYLISLGFAVWRWQILLRGLDVFQPFLRLARLVFVSYFFSMFLPTSVGGDVARMFMLTTDAAERKHGISSVLMDRVVGLAVVIGLGLGAAASLPIVRSDGQIMAALAVICGVFLFGLLILFNRPLLTFVLALLPEGLRSRIQEPAIGVYESLVSFRHRPAILLRATGVSLLLQIAICLAMVCAGQAFGIAVPILTYFALIPIGLATTALPISINGLGVQDQALVLLFSAVGVSTAPALALSLYFHLLRNSAGILGGIIFAVTRNRSAMLPTPDGSIE